jgi:hypothetical protein
MKLSVYISGKVTGEEIEACRKKFSAFENLLKNLGCYAVINPMNLGIPDAWPWDKSMELCMNVLKEKANCIFLLNDWVYSEGSMKEFYYARNHNYRIFKEDETDALVKLIVTEGKWTNTTKYELP